MTSLKNIKNKIFSIAELKKEVQKWKKNNDKIVFTNGCFDILHLGHIELLAKAADLGNKLIIAVNSDASIKVLKGEKRPILDEKSRSIIIASLEKVNAVIIFKESTPLDVIKKINPDIIVKGGDYIKEDVIGKNYIEKYGGEVIIFPLSEGFSTTSILEKIYNG
ncbi:D-glycero-beta-D-manno-heptose 1-phosphate adenylyltransferase [Flavobacteriales bacterium]|nr:D-glycero-beta-D-manno-heptose 1-phosphate adenylyltransferase [Flavobacteriales bacterium]